MDIKEAENFSMSSRVKRSTQFVKDGRGVYYLPRPTSWLSGWARRRWFEQYIGAAHIASPPMWEELVKKWSVFTLTEYEDGVVLTGKL